VKCGAGVDREYVYTVTVKYSFKLTITDMATYFPSHRGRFVVEHEIFRIRLRPISVIFYFVDQNLEYCILGCLTL
jgi:hypothetical protein